MICEATLGLLSGFLYQYCSRCGEINQLLKALWVLEMFVGYGLSGFCMGVGGQDGADKSAMGTINRPLQRIGVNYFI